MSSDLVAQWSVPLSDRVHNVEFEHGTTSGKRVVWVDKKKVVRKDYMFKLVGSETFNIGNARCVINIDAQDGFCYSYSLQVNGKKHGKFSENQSKVLRVWHWNKAGLPFRIVLEKDTLDIWVNGRRMQTTGEFVDDGTETHFTIGDENPAYIKAVSSGRHKVGVVHCLFINGEEIPPSHDSTLNQTLLQCRCCNKVVTKSLQCCLTKLYPILILYFSYEIKFSFKMEIM